MLPSTWGCGEQLVTFCSCFRVISSHIVLGKKISFLFLKVLFFNLLLESFGKAEKGRETLMYERNGSDCHTPPTGDLACNPSMCPDWESNQWPFGSQAGTQSTEPYQLGREKLVFLSITGCAGWWRGGHLQSPERWRRIRILLKPHRDRVTGSTWVELPLSTPPLGASLRR